MSDEAAERMADMKKVEMAEAAERLLATTDWLPALLKTAKPVPERSDTSPDAQASGACSLAAE